MNLAYVELLHQKMEGNPAGGHYLGNKDVLSTYH